MDAKNLSISVLYHAPISEISSAAPFEWIDLRAGEDVFVPLGQYKRLSLGVSMRLPDGFQAIVAPRSSTFERYGIIMTSGVGIIDNRYQGPDDIWHFPAFCLAEKEVRNGKPGTFIPMDAKIAQFMIIPIMPTVTLQKVDILDAPNRDGFGSTDRCENGVCWIKY